MYKSTTLENGLKIISKELETVKTTLVIVQVKAGSKFVPQKKEGLAHLLEHMIMNGSEKYPNPLIVRRTIEEVGGTINAKTGTEEAVFLIKVASEDLDEAADVLFSLVTHPILNKKELPGEQKIILEEIAKDEDRIERSVSDNFYALVFGKHPLGRRVLGYRETVGNISMEDVANFFGNYYLPQNMVVCAAGNTKHEKIVGLVKDYFAAAPQKEVPKYQPFQGKPAGPKVAILKKPANQAHLMLGFLTSPKTVEEHILGKFVCRLLNSKDRLFARLREQEKLAYSVSATYDRYEEVSLPSIGGGFSYKMVDRATKALTEELQKLKKEAVGERELAKIRKLIEVDFLFNLETPGGWVNFAMFTDDLIGHPIEPEEYLKKIAKVGAVDIQKFAQETFTPKRAYLSVSHGSTTSEELEEILRNGLRD